MKALFLRILSIPLFLAGAAGLVLALFLAFQESFSLSPLGQVVIWGLVCLSVYLGAFCLGATLSPQGGRRLMRGALFFLFLCYLCLVASFTLLEPLWGRQIAPGLWNRTEGAPSLAMSLNLIPLRTIGGYGAALLTGSQPFRVIFINLAGNLGAFMPFALFLPLLFPTQRRWKRFLVTMVLIICGVELCQLILMAGVCDVDDLILNLGGAAILYAFLRLPVIQRLLSRMTFDHELLQKETTSRP